MFPFQSPDRILAVIATGVAGVALLVAFLQVFLQYITSSPLRDKCNAAAIGCASRLVKWGFSWTLTVHYPLLDLSAAKIISAARSTEQNGIEVLDLQEEGKTGFVFIKDTEIRSWKHVKHEDIYLVHNRSVPGNLGEREKVTVFQLSWKKKMIYLWFKLRHKPQFPRPRACWAQMLYALGADDVSPLVYGLADANTVPSQLDAPMQRVTVSQMGKVAFLLSFTKVTIDHEHHTLSAYGPHGRITTIQVSSLGNVLHFEGDTHAIRKTIRTCPVSWTLVARDMMTARLQFPNVTTNGFYCPLNALAQSIVDAPHESEWFTRQMVETAQARVNSIAGNIHLESKSFKALNADDSVPREMKFDKWKASTQLRMPTVLTLMHLLPLPSVATPFPHDILLPYVPVLADYFKRRADYLVTRSDVIVSTVLRDALREGTIMFHLETSDYSMCRGINATPFGQRSWAMTPYRGLHAAMPPPLREQFLTETAGVGTSLAKILLTKDTLYLLRNFDPVKWSRDFSEEMKFALHRYGASNLLWFQVFLIDMAIQHAVNGRLLAPLYGSARSSVTDDVRRHLHTPVEAFMLELGSWCTKGGELARALCLAGCPLDDSPPTDGSASVPQWDLSAIIHAAGLGLDASTTEHLGVLLELRMVFMVAYLLSFADSSAVYYAEFQDFSLPIGLAMQPPAAESTTTPTTDAST
jgi:hypothetical protein